MHHRLRASICPFQLTQASLKGVDGQITSSGLPAMINAYFYSTQAPTAPDSILTDQYTVHTHLRHHKIGMITRRHMSTYAKTEKTLNQNYKIISLIMNMLTNEAPIFKQ